MRGRRLFVSLLLLALIVAAPLAAIALGGCADDDCPPFCGDCALCGPAAVFAAVPVDLVSIASTVVRPELVASLASAPTRAVEHVPLPQR
ncbi:MAG: hypothetical protein NDJ75_08125 [Thermoanaerobaculia bacterium]|nr:hypothetical protein [Thermoanaerobaculia bacterium]